MEEKIVDERSSSSKYDGIFKEVLLKLENPVVMEFISSLFNKKFQPGSTLERLSGETHINGECRNSDSVFKINDEVFIIELQSREDKEMSIRLMNYTVALAYAHGRNMTSAPPEINFPEAMVIYLRTDKDVPKFLDGKFNFHSMGEPISVLVKMPVVQLASIPVEEIIDKSLFPILPFYPMTFENELKLKNHNNLKELAFSESYKYLAEALLTEKAHAKIGDELCTNLFCELTDIQENVLKHVNLINCEEVNKVMEQMNTRYVLPLDRMKYEWQAKGIAEGEAKGEARGEARGERAKSIKCAKEMLKDNEPMEKIVKYTDLSEKEIVEIKNELAAKLSPPKKSKSR